MFRHPDRLFRPAGAQDLVKKTLLCMVCQTILMIEGLLCCAPNVQCSCHALTERQHKSPDTADLGVAEPDVMVPSQLWPALQPLRSPLGLREGAVQEDQLHSSARQGSLSAEA